MRRRCVSIGIMLFLATGLRAQEASRLYTDTALQQWQARYAENLQGNFTDVILPRLRPMERAKLDKVQLRFPLRAEPQAGLLSFSSEPKANPPVVTMPTLSIKFFDDLCIASAWLEENGYELGTVTDYVVMLKYVEPASFPGGKHLPPLEALQIPANALRNQGVDDLSQKLLKSALIWVFLHELGHIYHEHQGYGGITAQQAQQQEKEADQFGTEIMRRIAVAPIGTVQFFTIATYLWPNRADFTSDAAWEFYLAKTTHPLNADRLLSMAADLKRNQNAFVRSERNQQAALTGLATAITEIERLAQLLADEKLQQFSKQRAFTLAKQPNPLRPRLKEKK
jgi:hypothetical protein